MIIPGLCSVTFRQLSCSEIIALCDQFVANDLPEVLRTDAQTLLELLS